MAGGLQFSVKNKDDVVTQMLARATPEKTESAVRQAAVAGARIFRAEILLRTPRGTKPVPKGRSGRLADNLLISYMRERSVTGLRASYVVRFSREGWYARLLEFGTSKMPARPFIRPAFEAKQKEAIQVAAQRMKERLLDGQ